MRGASLSPQKGEQPRPLQSRAGLVLRLVWISAMLLGAQRVQTGLYQLGKLSPRISMPELCRVAVQAAGVQTPLTPGLPGPSSRSSHVPLSGPEAIPADGLQHPDVVPGKSCQGLLAGVSFSPVRIDIFSV